MQSRCNMSFEPDWVLPSRDRLAVVLTLALAMHIPNWPGATDEQLGAVAEDIFSAINARLGMANPLNDEGEIRPMAEIEANMIRLTLGHNRGNIAKAARRLGISRTTLYRKMQKLGIDPKQAVKALQTSLQGSS